MAKVKDKQRILKTAREKQRVSYKGNPINWFLYRNFAGQKGVAKYIISPERDMQPRIFNPAKLSFRVQGKVKNFSDKQKLKELSNTILTLKY